MDLNNITVEFEDVSLDEANSKIYEFALKQACAGYHGYSVDTFSLFFTGNRLLKIWNLYPDLRLNIFNNIIMRSYFWKNHLPREDSLQMISNCITICKKIAEDRVDDLSPEWARTQDRLVDLGYISVERDLLGNLERLSVNQTGKTYEYWLNQYMNTLDSSNEKEFENLYLSIKRAPGATDIRRIILDKALQKEALSETILKKVVKSAPITIRRSIVGALSDQKSSCQRILYYQDGPMRHLRHLSRFTEKDFELAKEKAAKIESKLILFAPLQDPGIQSSLIESLDKENLVWIVPAVSSLGRSYLSDRLQRRMSQ